MSTTSAPEALDVFGLEPEVADKEQLPIFMRAIAKLRGMAETITSKANEVIRRKQEETAEKLLITIEGEALPMPKYAAALEQAVLDFARDQHDDLFSEKCKTWKCDAGALTTKTQPEKVAFTDPNTDEDTIVKAIVERSDLLPELDRIRAEFAEAFPYIRISLELDKASIIKAYQAQQLTAAELEAQGLKIDRNADKYTLKLS